MYSKIDELIDKYRCFLSMARTSINGCSNDDLIYSQFCYGKFLAYEEILKDLESINKQSNE